MRYLNVHFMQIFIVSTYIIYCILNKQIIFIEQQSVFVSVVSSNNIYQVFSLSLIKVS